MMFDPADLSDTLLALALFPLGVLSRSSDVSLPETIKILLSDLGFWLLMRYCRHERLHKHRLFRAWIRFAQLYFIVVAVCFIVAPDQELVDRVANASYGLLHVLYFEATLYTAEKDDQQDVSTAELMEQMGELDVNMEGKCRICLTAKSDAMWEDCGHAMWCMSCYKDTKNKGGDGKCPFCQKGKNVRKVRFV